MSAPQTTINICGNVRLDNRYIHSIFFDDVNEQLSYFAGKVVKSFSGYSYCRKSWSIKVDAKLEEARRWNYLYFQNTSSGKWWFYFINQVEYVNDNTVELFLELDVVQTYITEIYLPPCYIERQHEKNDYFGMNQVDENLDVGELMCWSYTDADEIEELCILLMSSIEPMYSDNEGDEAVPAVGALYNNVYSGLRIFATPLDRWRSLETTLNNLSDNGYIDSVVSMWMYPKKLVNLVDGYSFTNNPGTCMPVASVVSVQSSHTVKIGARYASWTNKPKNKKTLQYPYNFLQVSNNQGTTAVYRFERFSNLENTDPYVEQEIAYTLYGAYSPDATVKAVFNNYDMMPHETAISIGNYPTCAWSADTYKIWLAQNQNQRAVEGATAGLSIVAGAGTAIAGLATGNLVLAGTGAVTAVSGAKQIASLNAQKKDMAIQPPQARGHHSASVNIASGKQTFTFYHRCLDSYHTQLVDNYFTMYGYAIKAVRAPILNARRAYTYIKTVGCTVSGRMCNEDRVKFENILDNGITFWIRGDDIGDYTINNSAF